MNPEVLANLSRVASALEALGIDDAVFVGGAIVGLLLTDPAAPEVRATFDVDVVTPVASRSAYHAVEHKLRQVGYVQPPGGPICRWLIEQVPVDLMPPDPAILGFSNRWYHELVMHAQTVRLPSGATIRLASAPYLLATKLEAFQGRGEGDYRVSHDLEDIILLDGREELSAEVASASQELRTYIAEAFQTLLANAAFVDAVGEHLLPDAASQGRVPVILERMRRVARQDR